LRGIAVGWFLVVAIVTSAFFYPVWTGQSIPDWYRTIHVWLPTW
jgi:dolichyl-phosphate-mannose--protein O-mannosyl transferase